MKKYFQSFILIFGFIFIFSFFVVLLYYFDWIGMNLYHNTMLFTPIVGVIIGGVVLGKTSTKKAYIEGLKLTSIIILVLMLLALISKTSFTLASLVYYLVLLLSAVISSMIGINLKKD